ncbi:hypothetical protein M9458_016829, partial [Cirrhinus mrigala]
YYAEYYQQYQQLQQYPQYQYAYPSPNPLAAVSALPTLSGVPAQPVLPAAPVPAAAAIAMATPRVSPSSAAPNSPYTPLKHPSDSVLHVLSASPFLVYVHDVCVRAWV